MKKLLIALVVSLGISPAWGDDLSNATLQSFIQVWSEMVDVDRNLYAQHHSGEYPEGGHWYTAERRKEQILERYAFSEELYEQLINRMQESSEFYEYVSGQIDAYPPQTFDAYCSPREDRCTLWLDGIKYQPTREEITLYLPTKRQSDPDVDICEMGGLCFDFHGNVVGIQ